MVQSLEYIAQLLKQYQKNKNLLTTSDKKTLFYSQMEFYQLVPYLKHRGCRLPENFSFLKFRKSGWVIILIRQNRNGAGFNQVCITRLETVHSIKPKIRNKSEDWLSFDDSYDKTTTLHVQHTFLVHFFAVTARLQEFNPSEIYLHLTF